MELIGTSIKDTFWSPYRDLVRTAVVPYQWAVMNDEVEGAEPSHVIANFKIAAGVEKGDFYGFVFQDSDLAKWLETVAYSLASRPDPELEALADQAIDLIAEAQGEDGYLNTYFTIKAPQDRWTNLHEAHELYCAGHFIEAAVAYERATGKRKLLDVMRRYADLIDSKFGTEEGKLRGYCGHPEIELALVRLYEATGEERYLRLSRYFVDERGREPYYFEVEAKKRGGRHILPEFAQFNRSYLQAHERVREQESAEGHAVRVVYLYSAVAGLARLTGDRALIEACRRIWRNITTRRMYVTGGIGSASFGESFTGDWDLPNETMYTETCASVGMVFFARRMLALEGHRRYADVMELELYNGALSGISLDGKRYFYVNPLEVRPDACRVNPTLKHVKASRQAWYPCACCPPNIARLIASLDQYVYSVAGVAAGRAAGSEGPEVSVHLYVGGEAKLRAGKQEVSITQETAYPYEGTVRLTVRTGGGAAFKLRLRIPGWCETWSCAVDGVPLAGSAGEDGYLAIDRTWLGETVVELRLDMPVRLLRAHPKVASDAGKVAIARGPLVYCIEEVDNGSGLHNLSLATKGDFKVSFEPGLLGGTAVVRGRALRRSESDWNEGDLYAPTEDRYEEVELTAIPYALWCNRKPGEMLVWIRQERS
jgi:DUF1680 family protein